MQTGYKGRVGIYEVLLADEEIRRLIGERSSAELIYTLARDIGMQTMYEDGIEKIASGITTHEELIRVLHEDV